MSNVEMLEVTVQNLNKYSFKLSAKEALRCYKSDKEYAGMVEYLNEHLQKIMHTLMYFGDKEMARKMLTNFSELVEHECLPSNGRCRYFYEAIKDVRMCEKESWVTSDRCILLMKKMIDVVAVQYDLRTDR